MSILFLDLSSKKRVLYSDELLATKQNIKQVVSQIREEIQDHLSAINDNTNEIQSNFQYICELDSKIDKINERLEKIEIFLDKTTNFEIDKKTFFEVKPLTKKEQDVFLVLYTLDEKCAVTYKNLARNTGLTEDLVKTYITNLIQKGVPIKKRYINNKVFIKLDPTFKALQAKENILNLHQKTLL